MMETFWRTVGLYNSSTWIYQLIIILAGIILSVLVAKKPGRASTAAMKVFLIILYLWLSLIHI